MMKTLPFLLMVSLVTCCIEVDISVPSFPSISDHFNISDGLTQMTIAVNFLGFCIASILYGPLSDSYGRRITMVIGNFIMLVGALACAFSISIETLLLARFIQGIGASTSAVIVFAMIADVYSGAKSSKLIGTMNSLLTVFMSIAPIAGGFINQVAGWRGNYFVVAIVSFISWLLLYLYLPETKKEKAKFDTRQIARDFKILMTDESFLCSSIVPSLSFAGWMAFVACGSFLYMETYGISITQYSLHQGAIIAVFSVFSMYADNISNILGRRNCIISGVFLLFIGSIMLLLISATLTKAVYSTTIAMVIFGIGAAISYPIIFARSMEIFPEIRGTASSAIMFMRTLICSMVIAFVSYVYDGSLLNVALVILAVTVVMVVFAFKLFKLITFVQEVES